MSKDIKKQPQEEQPSQSRRTVLKALAGIPVLGAFGYELMHKLSYDKNKSANLLKAEKVLDEAAASDEYSYVRDAYLRHREYLVHDGHPPTSDDDFDLFDE